MAQLAASIPPVPPPVFTPSAIGPPPPIYSHLPAHLAQQYAALPELYPRRQASVAPVPAPQLEPAFAPVPAPAHYSHLPADLARQVAALPPLIERGRGRGRGRGRRNNTTFPAPAPLPFAEIAAQYAALPSVCLVLFVSLRQS